MSEQKSTTVKPCTDERMCVPCYTGEGECLYPAQPAPGQGQVVAQPTSWDCAKATITPEGLKCPPEGRCRDCPAPQPTPGTQGQAVAAWQHEEDAGRVISAAQKAQAIRDGGASASSVRPYSIALVAASPAPQPAQEGVTDAQRLTDS